MSTIGTLARLPEQIRSHGLAPFRELLPPTAFTSIWPVVSRATTVLIPEVTFWLMATVTLGDGAMSAAVMTFWAPLRAILPWLPTTPVTEEAFCIARARLPVAFFRALLAWVVSRFSERFDARLRWKGFRLLGIDGTTVNLPKSAELAAAFPGPSNQKSVAKRPQGLLVGLVGLWTGVCHAFVWGSLKRGEPRCARFLARFLGKGDLLLADRNFPGYHLLCTIINREAQFVMRVAENRFKSKVRRPTASGRSDEYYVDFTIDPKLRRMYPHLPMTLTLRVIEYQIKGFRSSRLITSLLDAELYPYEEIVALYHERWRQETQHADWKHTLQISNLRSESKQGILKEIFVQLTVNNLIRWIMAEAVGPEGKPVDLKFRDSKRLIVATIPVMEIAPVEDLPAIYRCLLETIARLRILVRPGRSYPRQNDVRGRNKGHGKVAKPARLASTSGVLCENV